MQLYVPAARGARTEVLRHHYDDLLVDGSGAERTLELVDKKYNWPDIVRKVKAYTQACSTCQGLHSAQLGLHGSIEPLPHLHSPLTDISVDFIISLPVSCQKCYAKSYNAILVIISQYTKQAYYFPCHDP
jgi:hypothetical protein